MSKVLNVSPINKNLQLNYSNKFGNVQGEAKRSDCLKIKTTQSFYMKYTVLFYFFIIFSKAFKSIDDKNKNNKF